MLGLGSSQMEAKQKKKSDEMVPSLVMAMHLTQPEVIDGCLQHVKESTYKFAWTSIDAVESSKPSNLKITLNGTLVDARSQKVVPNKVAKLTLERDVEKLKKGQIYVNCKLEYVAKK